MSRRPPGSLSASPSPRASRERCDASTPTMTRLTAGVGVSGGMIEIIGHCVDTGARRALRAVGVAERSLSLVIGIAEEAAGALAASAPGVGERPHGSVRRHGSGEAADWLLSDVVHAAPA